SGVSSASTAGTYAISIANTSFAGNNQAAFLSLNAASTASFASNTGSGNATNGIMLNGSAGQGVSLGATTNLPYVIDALSIPTGYTMTIPAGVTVKMRDTSSALNVTGGLRVLGTEASPVTFTSLKDDS